MAAENCLGAAGGPTSSVKYSIVESSDMLTPSYKLTEILRRVESVRKIILHGLHTGVGTETVRTCLI